MIAGGVALVIMFLFFTGYFLINNSDLFWPPPDKAPKNNDDRAQDDNSIRPPLEVLANYVAANHGEQPPPELAEPSLSDWRDWLTSMDVKESIDVKWKDYANAVLRNCTQRHPAPFANSWKQKGGTFHKAITNFVKRVPEAIDLTFLLLAKDVSKGPAANAFTRAALGKYHETSPAKETPRADDAIRATIDANNLYHALMAFLNQETDDSTSAEKRASELAGQYASLSWLPRITSDPNDTDLRGKWITLFLNSFQGQYVKNEGPTKPIEFDKFCSAAENFTDALTVLTNYANNPAPTMPGTNTPTVDMYRRVYCNLPTDLNRDNLNNALKSLKKVPPTADDLANAAKRIVAWDHVKSELEKTPQPVTGRENRFFIAKNIPYFETIAAELLPHISLPDEASTPSADNRIWQTTYRTKHDEERQKCCRFEASQSANGTDLLIIFPDNKTAKILSRIPISLEHTGFQKRTANTQISEEPFEYTLSNTKRSDPVPTTAKLVADGEKRLLETAPLQGADGIPFTDLLKALGGQQHLSCEFELSKTAEQMGGELSDDGEFSGISIPTADGPEKEGFKGSELVTEIAFSLNAANGLVELKLNAPNTDPMRPFPKRTVAIGLEKNLLGYASDNNPLILDIAEIVLNIEPKAVDKKAELKEYLSYIANNQNFGSPNDWFGEEPLRGPNAQIFPTQDFTSPKDSIPTQTNRRLIGRSEYNDLSKRSWEMTFASFLVKASQKFEEKKADYQKPNNEDIQELNGEIQELRKNAKKNEEQIQEKKQLIETEKEKVRKPIRTWLTSGWVKEIDAIVDDLDPSKVRFDNSGKDSEETYRERVRICKDLYSKLRPFVARYLLAFHDEEAEKVTIDSLVEVTVHYETPNSGQIEIAKILPPENAPPEQSSDQRPAPVLPATEPK